MKLILGVVALLIASVMCAQSQSNLEIDVFNKLNKTRQKNNINPLEWSGDLFCCARDHAIYLSNNKSVMEIQVHHTDSGMVVLTLQDRLPVTLKRQEAVLIAETNQCVLSRSALRGDTLSTLILKRLLILENDSDKLLSPIYNHVSIGIIKERRYYTGWKMNVYEWYITVNLMMITETGDMIEALGGAN